MDEEAERPNWPIPTPSRCKEAAERIQEIIGGDAIHITPDAPFADFLGPSDHDPTGRWRWTHHYAVQKGDRIYDAWTGPEGLPVEAFKAQWWDSELAIEIVELNRTQDVRQGEAEEEPAQDPEEGEDLALSRSTWRTTARVEPSPDEHEQPHQDLQTEATANPSPLDTPAQRVREWMREINAEDGALTLPDTTAVWAFVSDPANHHRLPEDMTSADVRAVCDDVDLIMDAEEQAAQAAQREHRHGPSEEPPPPPPRPQQGPTFG